MVVKRSQSTPSEHPSHAFQQPRDIIDLTGSDSDDDNNLSDVHYPGIHNMLVELDSELPLLGITQYEPILAANGFLHINQLVDEGIEDQLRAELGIPLGVTTQLRNRAERLMRRTQKLKQEE